ncbi:MAG: hypothetical protein QXT13_11890 [Pyrobaculum sp.]
MRAPLTSAEDVLLLYARKRGVFKVGKDKMLYWGERVNDYVMTIRVNNVERYDVTHPLSQRAKETVDKVTGKPAVVEGKRITYQVSLGDFLLGEAVGYRVDVRSVSASPDVAKCGGKKSLKRRVSYDVMPSP